MPVDIISADEFKNLRVSSVAELSKYLSIASGSHFQTNALDGVDQGMAAITLRGLDHASTLVLINKKRQTHAGTPSNDGEGYIDVNIIHNLSSIKKEIDFSFINQFFTTNSKENTIYICCRSKGSLERVSKILSLIHI